MHSSGGLPLHGNPGPLELVVGLSQGTILPTSSWHSLRHADRPFLGNLNKPCLLANPAPPGIAALISWQLCYHRHLICSCIPCSAPQMLESTDWVGLLNKCIIEHKWSLKRRGTTCNSQFRDSVPWSWAIHVLAMWKQWIFSFSSAWQSTLHHNYLCILFLCMCATPKIITACLLSYFSLVTMAKHIIFLGTPFKTLQAILKQSPACLTKATCN